MTKLFEQLWNGKIIPYEDCGKNDLELAKVAELVERNKTDLKQELSEKGNRILDTYIACCQEHSYLVTVHAFREGFALACKLLAESLTPET